MGGPWDIAAGSLLVKEARGKVTDIEGGKNYVYGKSIVAANAPIHADLMERLKGDTKKTKAAS
jgi:myo-inositol-1(or 4)-monophosphatase